LERWTSCWRQLETNGFRWFSEPPPVQVRFNPLPPPAHVYRCRFCHMSTRTALSTRPPSLSWTPPTSGGTRSTRRKSLPRFTIPWTSCWTTGTRWPGSRGWLSRREMSALAGAVQNRGSKRDLALTGLLLHTRLRVAEACSLVLDDMVIRERSGIVLVRGRRAGVPRDPVKCAPEYLRVNDKAPEIICT